MTTQTPFVDLLDHRQHEASTLLCVGLDPVVEKLPAGIERSAAGVVRFCSEIIEATAPFTAAYKPNLAFFMALGHDGLDALWQVCRAIPETIPTILDCKVGDVSSTAAAYARAWFDELNVNAITVNPYLGTDALEPFLAYEGRGVIVICKTSNPGSGEFQDQVMPSGAPMYMDVAERSRAWEADSPASVGLVVGANYPEQLEAVRARIANQVILLPGVGAQAGDLEASVRAGVDANGGRLLCSSSRSIIFADSGTGFASAAGIAASALRDSINAIASPNAVAS